MVPPTTSTTLAGEAHSVFTALTVRQVNLESRHRLAYRSAARHLDLATVLLRLSILA